MKTIGLIGGMSWESSLEEQRDSTIALELICNCVAYWNAKNIKKAVDKLTEQDQKINPKDIRYITPMITRHINRFGRFEFDVDKRNKNVPAV